MTARIEIAGAGVSFYTKRPKGLSGAKGAVGGRIVPGRTWRAEIIALEGISLTLGDGDRMGLVGGNGSGKTTLLKLCAGAVSPTTGSVSTEGNVSAQFSLGGGIRPSLSGRLNAELRCLYTGIAMRDIPARVAEVQVASGLGDFFEMPVSSYSAGMRSRLLLSLMQLTQPEILLIDEWIGTTDTGLREAAEGLQARLMSSARIVMLASHSSRVLKEWTTTALWLDRGTIRMSGPTEDVIRAYADQTRGR